MNITSFIKDRILNDFGSVRKFAQHVGIPTSTLNTALNKENGFNNMPVENAIKVCNALGFEVESLYDSELEPLTTDEKKLVEIYKGVSQVSKDLLMSMAESINEFDKKNVTIIMPILDETLKPTTALDYYPQAAGMGGGQYVKDAIPEKLIISTDKIPPKTDFIIRVVGDSMEPTFYSGDKLFIQSTSYLEEGDIGVFNVDGEQMVKETGKGELISHNPEYPPIKTEHCHLVVQGKVLGRL